MPLPPISVEDREHILRHTDRIWRELAGARFFITGGTGFYGKWLLEAINAANDHLGAKVRATILSRNPLQFAAEVPHLANRPEFFWLTGDAADFAFPEGRFDYAFHFATASAAEVGAGGMATIMHTLRGTERVLQFARSSGVKRLLFASSGAVYGPQPAHLSHIPEDYPGGPDPTRPASAYGEMKRLCELMCVSSGVDCVIARGFSFVGPYLPLADKFAAGSFIRDALSGGPIRVRSDGTAVRSYMYAADLAAWLVTLLVSGRAGNAYNVGSEIAVSMNDLAQRVALHCGSGCFVAVAPFKETSPPDVYVPSTAKARRALGMQAPVPLEHALLKTLRWAASIPAGIQCVDHG